MKHTVEKGLQAGISLLLFVLIFIMIHNVNSIQGTARVVNYAGLVRGETQRAVKLEVVGQPSPELIAKLDGFLDGIQNGSAELQLIRIEDDRFQEKVEALCHSWAELKAEIERVRSLGYAGTEIVAMSEAYFALSDEMVGLAEDYTQRLASSIRTLELAVVALIACLLAFMIKQSIEAFRVLGMNRELKKQVFWDDPTGLPNKNRCEELLNQPELIREKTTVFMFDLNNLKYVNDNLGHASGDALIASFAGLIRAGVPEPHFVGRYGGDEFIAIVTGEESPAAEEIVAAVQAKADAFNLSGMDITISYAVGYASSADTQACTLRTLLAQADTRMYENKKLTKEQAMEVEESLNVSLSRMVQALGREYSDCCYCNLKTGSYRLIGSPSNSKIPKIGQYHDGFHWLGSMIADEQERQNFAQILSDDYLAAHLDEAHPSYDVTCHFHGTAREWWRLTAVFVDSDADRLSHFLLLFKEISDEKELEFEAKHDGLTGLWSKTAAIERVKARLNENTRQHMMMVLDLDDFKLVNDTMGHTAGDAVLKKAAEIIRGPFREEDIVARFGGDEFFVFLEGELSKASLEAKASRIRQQIEQAFQKDGEPCGITISIGVIMTDRPITVSELFRKADEALYTAKRQGKNQSLLIDERTHAEGEAAL